MGVSMATDIAFAQGVLALLGGRPGRSKYFSRRSQQSSPACSAGDCAVYSSGIAIATLAVGIGVLLVLGILNLVGIRSTLVYSTLGVVVWVAFLQSGVHATIAGVLVALTVPARRRINEAGFVSRVRALLAHFEGSEITAARMLTDERQQSAIIELEEACEAVQAPLQKPEHQLNA
jgi:NhaA family Na+:H+ antiporter